MCCFLHFIQVNNYFVAWDFTKLFLVPFLITAKAPTKAGITTALTSAIYELFPSPKLTIIIIVNFFYNHQCMKNKSTISILLLPRLSLCSCSCKMASDSQFGQTLSNPKLFLLWLIKCFKSEIISMKG